MAFRTEKTTCNSCGGAGSHQRTDWVSNPHPTGATTIPVTRRETCYVCCGTGTVSKQVYVPDPPRASSSHNSPSPTRQPKNRKKRMPADVRVYPVGSEELEKANAKFLSHCTGLPVGVGLFIFLCVQSVSFATATTVGLVAYGSLFYLLSYPFRWLTLGVASTVTFTFKILIIAVKVVAVLAGIIIAGMLLLKILS